MSKLVEILLSETIKSIFDYVKKMDLSKFLKKDILEPNLNNHINEIYNWSKQVQLFGMTESLSTIDNTIKLNLNTIPRSFRSLIKETKQTDEIELIESENNYIILGDPGSGKTTTLKRICQNVLLNNPLSELGIWQFPILLVLKRYYTKDNTLSNIIADKLGITYEVKRIEEKIERNYNSKKLTPQEIQSQFEIKVRIEYWLGNRKLEEIIPEILNEANAILFIDGIDEIQYDLREKLDKEITELSLKLSGSKIIATCRSGDYNKQIEGFNVVEICPLSHSDILDITKKWCPDWKLFHESIKELPYYDLTNRPLFLIQLIIFYNNMDYLPEQPSEVYARIINLLIEKWDYEQGVKRKSKYSKFYPPQKIKFLSALSYYLTFSIKAKVFSENDLIKSYNSIYQRFALPISQSSIVARELESHTGIIVKSGDQFEFSHLSLQEYLTANHIVSEPFPALISNYIREYPAPLAIAVVLSSNSSDYFSSIILNSNYSEFEAEGLRSFLYRLSIEKPYFSESIYLGFSIIKLLFLNESQSKNYTKVLIKQPTVKKSLARAIENYQTSSEFYNSNSITIELSYFNSKSYERKYKDFQIPQKGELAKEVFDILVDENLINVGERGGIYLFNRT